MISEPLQKGVTDMYSMDHAQFDAKDAPETKKKYGVARKNLLIVDDEESIRNLLKRILEKEGYHCIPAADAEEASIFLAEHPVDLVISDIQMPGRSGIQLLEEIRREHPTIGTIIITGNRDKEIADMAISIGAYGYLLKPFQKDQVVVSVKDALRRRMIEIQNRFEVENLEHDIEDKRQNLIRANTRLTLMVNGIIRAMAKAVESRDPYTAGHQQRVADIATVIGARMNFTEERIMYLKMAASIHDIGKISVPAEILSKPGRLSQSEMNIIREHPLTGYEILKEVEFPYPLAEIVYQHHERMDGSGYPNGLTGEQIHLDAKILAVADVLEAMASHRPYRAALGIAIAREEIQKNKGRFYDPDVVDVCCQAIDNGEIAF
ncbi:MAG: response regulator [Desulfobacteraceae bacterium]|nr:MAG: response regulator [Desulfobacteraceae bacterium]